MRTTISWSYDLLDADEQALFARLAIFRGGATLEDAERVCNADLDTLASLLDKSLVRRRTDSDGEERFWMLEMIREFAWARLADDVACHAHHHVVELAVLEVILEAGAARPRDLAVDHVELAVIDPPDIVLPPVERALARIEPVLVERHRPPCLA